MKQRIFVALLALALAVPATAGAVGIGVGIFGGPSIPVLQDNAGTGSQFGVRIPVSIIPLIGAEPYFSKSSLGDKEETFGGLTYTRSGPDVTTYGLNAMLSMGGPLQYYPYLGIGSTKIEQEGSDDLTETNFNFGMGLALSPIPKLTAHLRAELNSVLTSDTSRKFANVTVGVSYALFSVP